MPIFLALGLLVMATLSHAGEDAGKASEPLQPSTDRVKPALEPTSAGGASTGSSALPATGPADAELERRRAEDERRATESKEKMKQRPGYKDNVPTPRA